jgi:UDP-N-acetylmuramoyl-tripeptide--D-alanyl-D-alanine ligase
VLVIADPLVAGMASRTAARVLSVGTSAAADVRVERLRLDALARPRFTLSTPDGSVELALTLSGEHHAMNAAVAAAIGLSCGIGLDTVADVLSKAVPRSAHRMQLASRDDGLLVVDDAYNANPESVRSALESLARLGSERPGRTWAVLGEMRELGSDADDLHHAVGRHAAEVGVDELVVIGTAAAPILEGWELAAQGRPARLVDDGDEAVRAVNRDVVAGDTVLVKGSNALALWRVAESLLLADEELRAEAGTSA